MNELTEHESNELKPTDPITFGITPVSRSKINPKAVALVNEFLPELDEKTKFFDRGNSQSTLSMMSLTSSIVLPLCTYLPFASQHFDNSI